MKFEVTASPSPEDEAFVVARTRAYNAAFMPNDVQALCVFARTDDGEIVGGLTGKTYWNYLEVSFLWVHEQHRGFGHATALMSAAEAEALRRGVSTLYSIPSVSRRLASIKSSDTKNSASSPDSLVVMHVTIYTSLWAMANNCLESARVARPTRKSETLLLAAQAGR